MKPKILIIGSRDHDRADCVDWLQPFTNIEEYDSIIINLQSLTQEVYDRILTKIRRMKESIATVFHTDREIFCIMNKCISPSPPPRPLGAPEGEGIVTGYVSPTNYDWLPTTVTISDKRKGTSINVSDHRFDRYFQWVDKWEFELSQSIRTPRETFQTLMYSIIPIAENKSKKMIAGTVKRGGFLKESGKGEFPLQKGGIHLLPPPTKCGTHQAIEIILDLIYGEEGKIVPPWREEIEVPKVREIQQEIERKITDIQGIQQEIAQLKSQIGEWDSYRDLLTSTGSDLENIVQKALSEIGIKTKKTEKGFPADLISKEVAVEITGIKGCVGVSSEKVNQTGRFKESYHKREKIILVANTYMHLSPKDRKRKLDFSPEVKKYFESLSVCCLTTMTLFQLWRDIVTEKKDPKDVKRKILTKNGELTLNEF